MKRNNTDIGRFTAVMLAVITVITIPLLHISRSSLSAEESAVQSLIGEFAKKSAENEMITLEDYESLLERLSLTGTSYDVELKVGRTLYDSLPTEKSSTGVLQFTPTGIKKSCLSEEYKYVNAHIHTQECYPGHNHEISGCVRHEHETGVGCNGKCTMLGGKKADGRAYSDTHTECPSCKYSKDNLLRAINCLTAKGASINRSLYSSYLTRNGYVFTGTVHCGYWEQKENRSSKYSSTCPNCKKSIFKSEIVYTCTGCKMSQTQSYCPLCNCPIDTVASASSHEYVDISTIKECETCGGTGSLELPGADNGYYVCDVCGKGTSKTYGAACECVELKADSTLCRCDGLYTEKIGVYTVKEACPFCNGRKAYKCSNCNGNGSAIQYCNGEWKVGKAIPTGYLNCHRCGQEEYYYYVVCSACNKERFIANACPFCDTDPREAAATGKHGNDTVECSACSGYGYTILGKDIAFGKGEARIVMKPAQMTVEDKVYVCRKCDICGKSGEYVHEESLFTCSVCGLGTGSYGGRCTSFVCGMNEGWSCGMIQNADKPICSSVITDWKYSEEQILNQNPSESYLYDEDEKLQDIRVDELLPDTEITLYFLDGHMTKVSAKPAIGISPKEYEGLSVSISEEDKLRLLTNDFDTDPAISIYLQFGPAYYGKSAYNNGKGISESMGFFPVEVRRLPKTVTCPYGHVYEAELASESGVCPICDMTLTDISVYPSIIYGDYDMKKGQGNLNLADEINVLGMYASGRIEYITDYESDYDPSAYGRQKVTVTVDAGEYEYEASLFVIQEGLYACEKCLAQYAPEPDGSDGGCPYCSGGEAYTQTNEGETEGTNTICPLCFNVYDSMEYPQCPYCSGVMTGIHIELLQTVLKRGENLNLMIFADYADGRSELLESGYFITGFNPNVVGEQEVTVTYYVFNDSATVVVEADEFEADNGEPADWDDNAGDIFDTDGFGKNAGKTLYYSVVYNDEIQSSLVREGVYRLKKGDYLSICVQQSSSAMSSVTRRLTSLVTDKSAYIKKYTAGEVV